MLSSDALSTSGLPACVVLADCPITAADALTALEIIGEDPRDAHEPLHVSVVVPPVAPGGLIGETVRRLAPTDFQARFADQLSALDAAPIDAGSDAVLSSVVTAFDAVGCAVSERRTSADPIDESGHCVDDCSAQTIIAFTTDAVRDDEFADEWANLMEDRANASFVHLYPAPAASACSRQSA